MRQITLADVVAVYRGNADIALEVIARHDLIALGELLFPSGQLTELEYTPADPELQTVALQVSHVAAFCAGARTAQHVLES